MTDTDQQPTSKPGAILLELAVTMSGVVGQGTAPNPPGAAS
jgi:hypothetical protein